MRPRRLRRPGTRLPRHANPRLPAYTGQGKERWEQGMEKSRSTSLGCWSSVPEWERTGI